MYRLNYMQKNIRCILVLGGSASSHFLILIIIVSFNVYPGFLWNSHYFFFKRWVGPDFHVKSMANRKRNTENYDCWNTVLRPLLEPLLRTMCILYKKITPEVSIGRTIFLNVMIGFNWSRIRKYVLLFHYNKIYFLDQLAIYPQFFIEMLGLCDSLSYYFLHGLRSFNFSFWS